MPLFAGLSGRDLRNLAAATHDITYPAGTELTSLKDLPATFFIIVEGRANVTADGQVRTSMGPREWFGELAHRRRTTHGGGYR